MCHFKEFGSEYTHKKKMEIVLFLLTIFLIQNITTAEYTVYIDEGDSKVIECSEGMVLNISYASYDGKAVFCSKHEVTSLVQVKCQWRRSCTLQSTDDIYRDTCAGPDESLNVKYNCQDDCYYVINNKIFYNGTTSITKSGKKCQNWESNIPHIPNFRPKGQRNYCRNPDNDTKIWCYTTDPLTRWEYCDIQQCVLPVLSTTPHSVTGGRSEENDTPVAIILGVLFALLVTSIILVVVMLRLKRRGLFKENATRQRQTYVYAAPENDQTLLGRVRRIIRWNKKESMDEGVIASNPGYVGYAAMQGDKIDPIDYSDAAIVTDPRVYEIPSKEHDKHNQLYTSLYDCPNGSVQNGEDPNLDHSDEHEYELPQKGVKPSKPAVAVKPILKKPMVLPKPSPKTSPKQKQHKSLGTGVITTHLDQTDNQALRPEIDSNSSNKDLAGSSLEVSKDNLQVNAMKQSSSAVSLVKLQIQKFNNV